MIISFVLIPSRYLAKADCRAKPGGAYFLSVGDTVFSPPTTDARLTIQFISLPTFHLEVRRILVFLIKLSSFLKQIFHIYYFLEEKHFYKKNLVVEQLKHTLSPFLLYNLCVAPIYKKPFFGILVIKISLYIFFCNLITLPIYVCVYPRILVMCQVH